MRIQRADVATVDESAKGHQVSGHERRAGAMSFQDDMSEGCFAAAIGRRTVSQSDVGVN